MGLYISGLVIDKNYENNIAELESVIGQTLMFEKEETFEETLESWKEDTYCVFFKKRNTGISIYGNWWI